MAICRALIKYGNSNFSLEILEYCDSKDCLKREQYYIDLLKPKYNILKIAGSRIGKKHSQETRDKISAALLGRIISNETRAKILGEKNPMFGKARPEGSGSPSKKISVCDLLNNETIIYESITSAAKFLNISKSVISKFLSKNQQKPYKNRYVFKRCED
jgi:group I intron endonuclease